MNKINILVLLFLGISGLVDCHYPYEYCYSREQFDKDNPDLASDVAVAKGKEHADISEWVMADFLQARSACKRGIMQDVSEPAEALFAREKDLITLINEQKAMVVLTDCQEAHEKLRNKRNDIYRRYDEALNEAENAYDQRVSRAESAGYVDAEDQMHMVLKNQSEAKKIYDVALLQALKERGHEFERAKVSHQWALGKALDAQMPGVFHRWNPDLLEYPDKFDGEQAKAYKMAKRYYKSVCDQAFRDKYYDLSINLKYRDPFSKAYERGRNVQREYLAYDHGKEAQRITSQNECNTDA